MTSELPFRQHVPRPPGASRAAVPLALFSRLGAEERARVFTLPHLEEALSNDASRTARLVTGGDRQVELGPPAAPSDGASAAVLVALGWGGPGEVKLLLTRRSPDMRVNPGEMAFPGGSIDEGESPAAAALREAHEEVSLLPGSARVIGLLPPVGRARRRGEILPVVASVSGAPELAANPSEVDAVFLVSLPELADPARYWEESWAREGGERWQMPFFERGEDLIWGASAAILVELLDLVAKYSSEAIETDRGGLLG